MRLVFLSYNYSAEIRSPDEWVEKIGFYTGWAKILAKEHTVIRVDQIDFEGKVEKDGILYHFFKDKRRKNYFPLNLNLFVRSLNPDLVLVSSFLFPLQVLLLRRCLGKKVKIIIQNHAEKPSSGINKIIQKIASRNVNAFLFNSYEFGLEWVQKGNIDSLEKIFEFPEVSSSFYPLDKTVAMAKTQSGGSPVFLWVGRLNPNKDPVLVISAFLKFAECHPAAKLYVIFQTEELLPTLKAMVEGCRPMKNIIFIGPVQHRQLLYWYNCADFFISASHYEGSGTALCEAMSCGCIPIVTQIPSFRTICGDSALLFEPGNLTALFNSLMNTANMNIESEKLKVLARFRQKGSFDSISVKFQAIVDLI
jgi:glycosyltransferase involved in cell wall biosynthesis